MTHSSLIKHIMTLPDHARQMVDHYFHLQLGGKTVVTPYFMNERKKKGAGAYVGKGSPAEIEDAVTRLAHHYSFDLTRASPQEIREFMIQHEIGVDCSGFVTWVLNELVKEKIHKPIWKVLSYSPLSFPGRCKALIRPVENISVRVLTDDANSLRISDLTDIRVGDMIRTLNGHHILLISAIGYDNTHTPLYFEYVNSTIYKVNYGVRMGRVNIIHPEKYLVDQQWIDGEHGVNWIYEAVRKYPHDSRIVRLKVLSSI